MSSSKRRTFEKTTNDILNNEEFKKLKEEHHHGISRYDHSVRVAENTFNICNFLKIDYEDATRAALLHDFFQDEDLKDMKTLNKYQAHPYLAYLKSSKMFNVNEVQKDAIICHMWPWTLKIPRYKESWIVTVSDKVISLREWFSFRLAVTVSIWILFFFNIITIQK